MDLMTYLLAKQNGGGGGGGSELPDVTSADNGKILGVFKGSWSPLYPDSVINIPMIQVIGELSNPLNLSELDDGLYGVRGPHSIAYDSTIFQTNSNVIAIIQTVNDKRIIRRITAEQEEIYTVIQNTQEIEGQKTVITNVDLNNYVTEEQMMMAIADIAQQVEANAEQYTNTAIDEAFQYSLQQLNNNDIQHLFV